MGLIGTTPIVRVLGKNGAIVTKAHAHGTFSPLAFPNKPDSKELIDGIKLGDLHENATKQVLLEIELGAKTAENANPSVRILEFTLSYTSTSSGSKHFRVMRKTIQGSLQK